MYTQLKHIGKLLLKTKLSQMLLSSVQTENVSNTFSVGVNVKLLGYCEKVS